MTQEQINRFVELQSMEMPDLIAKDLFKGAELYEDYAVLEFRLQEAMTLDDLAFLLEDMPDMVLLYIHTPSRATTFGHNTCAYSMPCLDRMWKVNATADSEEMCDSFTVTLYDSIEVMAVELRKEYRQKARLGEFTFCISEAELMHCFF